VTEGAIAAAGETRQARAHISCQNKRKVQAEGGWEEEEEEEEERYLRLTRKRVQTNEAKSGWGRVIHLTM